MCVSGRRFAAAVALALLLAPALGSAAEPPPAWLSQVRAGLAAREYHASPSAGGLQAPNRAHSLRTWFDADGIRVHDRVADGAPLLALRWTAVGRGGALAAVPPGRVDYEGARVEIRRPHAGWTEWYLNSPDGLEQGFEIAARPAGSGPLRLQLALGAATATDLGDALALRAPGGRELRYAKLAARDASGRSLPARLEVPTPQQIALVVDDAGARYPLSIDPLIGGVADAVIVSNQADAQLGASLAVVGDVDDDGYADVLIGAWAYDAGEADEGAAFLFRGGPGGLAGGAATSADAILQGGQAGARFGFSVAGAGDVDGDGCPDIVIGAPYYDDGENNEGAAFVFHGSQTGIPSGDATDADATLQSDQIWARLGNSVASAGDVNFDGYADLIVGAVGYTQGAGQGAAFVFHGSGSGIADGGPGTANSTLLSDQTPGDFGWSVASAGDLDGDLHDDVIVGAPNYKSGGIAHEGAAFVFYAGPNGVPSGDVGDGVMIDGEQDSSLAGWSVGGGDLNGDGFSDAVVGARYGPYQRGRVLVFYGGPNGISGGQVPDHVIEATRDRVRLGTSVFAGADVNGDGFADIVAGAPSWPDDLTNGGGAVFVFRGTPSGILDDDETTAIASVVSIQASEGLGWAVGAGDVDGDGFADVLAGANEPNDLVPDDGAAYFYRGGPVLVNRSRADAGWKYEPGQAGATVGDSVASAGDLDGDGRSEWLVGASRWDAGEVNEGAVFVYRYGSPPVLIATLQSNQVEARFGLSAASAGDVDGDGRSEIIVGAWKWDGTVVDGGAAFIFEGDRDASPATATTILEGDQQDSRFGVSVASAGDMNGDGLSDVIVGASHQIHDGVPVAGSAWVYLGSLGAGVGSGPPAVAAAQYAGLTDGEQLGVHVAGAGDVDGDGLADVLVGTRWDTYPQSFALLFRGVGGTLPDGDSTTADTVFGPAPDFPRHLAGAGDVNGDGFADVVVSAVETAYVWLGSQNGIPDGATSAAIALSSPGIGSEFGTSVAAAGDVNGDGFGDVVVGAPLWSNGESAEGAAFLYLGEASGIATTPVLRIEGDWAGQRFGTSVASAGDVDGDGFADLLFGTPSDGGGPFVPGGGAYVFLNGGRDASPAPRSPLGRLLLPWAITGVSGDPSWGELLWHPLGPGSVSAELEVCPHGKPWGDPMCFTSFYPGSPTTPDWIQWGPLLDPPPLQWEFDLPQGTTLYRARARRLYLPVSSGRNGTVRPSKPPHGPWHSLHASANVAGFRRGILQLVTPLDVTGSDVGLSEETSVTSYALDQLVYGIATQTPPALIVPPGRLAHAASGLRVFPADPGLAQIQSSFSIWQPSAATLQAGGGPGSFSFCPPVGNPVNPSCTAASQATGGAHGRVEYRAGPNQFGGTIRLLRQASGVRALRVATGPSIFSHQPFAVQTTWPGGGSASGSFGFGGGTLTQSPVLGPSGSIATPGIPIGSGPTPPPSAQTGFAFTTGTVIIERSTPIASTLVLSGSDNRTPSGFGQISLVAGGIVHSGLRAPHPRYAVLTLQLPEPGLVGLGVGVAALAGLYALWSRRREPPAPG